MPFSFLFLPLIYVMLQTFLSHLLGDKWLLQLLSRPSLQSQKRMMILSITYLRIEMKVIIQSTPKYFGENMHLIVITWL